MMTREQCQAASCWKLPEDYFCLSRTGLYMGEVGATDFVRFRIITLHCAKRDAESRTELPAIKRPFAWLRQLFNRAIS